MAEVLMAKPRLKLSVVAVAAALVVPLVLSALFTALLWSAGFLTFTGSQANATVIAAGLALAGALFGSLVSVSGLLLKHSIDTQAENRLHLEAERNAVLESDAAKRLKLEAAIEAVRLLATPSGTPAPSIQCSGALYSLAALGQLDLR
jgi:hypothetical protein